jgi:hypothetical protein
MTDYRMIFTFLYGATFKGCRGLDEKVAPILALSENYWPEGCCCIILKKHINWIRTYVHHGAGLEVESSEIIPLLSGIEHLFLASLPY